MRKPFLVSLALACLLQAASGCIITTDDDDDVTDRGDGNDGVDAGTGIGFLYHASFTCPSTATDIIITPTPAGSDTSQTAETFGCNENFGEIFFDPGAYDIVVQPVNDSDDPFLAQAETITGAEGDLVRNTFVFPDNAGYFFLTWTLSDSDSAPLACADLASSGVTVLSTLVDSDTALDDIFACEDGEGT